MDSSASEHPKDAPAADPISALLRDPSRRDHAVQVVRVFRHLVRDQEHPDSPTPELIRTRFKSAGLLPAVLLEAVRAADAPEEAATAFSAAIYPQRPYTLGEELAPRLGLFLEFFDLAPADPTVSLRARLQGLSESDFERLLSDLTAADHGRAKNESADESTATRRLGAALYLATCTPDEIEIILANWRDDAEMIRYLRTWLPSSPSSAGADPAESRGWPAWDALRGRLMAQARISSDDLPRRSIALELHACRVTSQLSSARRAPDRVLQVVAECWENHHDKLLSGFPHYAFRSHFARWWRICVRNWLIKHAKQPDLDGLGEAPVDDSKPELTVSDLRFFREGYRLVRSTFFAREDAGRTGSIRRAVDALWYGRFEPQLMDQDERDRVNDIAARLEGTGVGLSTINNLNRRLKLRIRAYTLSRAMGLSNEQIIEVRLPGWTSGSDYPFQDRTNQAGIRTVASVARLAPRDGTLLSAFTAQRVLRPILDAQHPEHWSFPAFLPELWRWVTVGTPDVLARSAGKPGDRAGRLLAARIERDPFRALFQALDQCDSEEEVQETLGRDSPLTRAAEEEAMDLRGEISGGGAECWSPEHVTRWKQIADQHWIIPAWFLLFPQGLDEDAYVDALNLDPPDRASLLALRREMTSIDQTRSRAASDGGD